MSGYLLIESRDPFESKGFAQRCDFALSLLGESSSVTLFLVENAVLAARAGAKTHGLEKLAKSGVRVIADEFALRERGIKHVAPDIATAGLDTLVGALAGGAKAMWN
jgi:sulfur relay (sulfurtransferase) complex TusBCD TusD component (DsrE family)